MAKKFEELLKKMSPERRARIEREHERAMAEMPLQQLRAARSRFHQQILPGVDAVRITGGQPRKPRLFIPNGPWCAFPARRDAARYKVPETAAIGHAAPGPSAAVADGGLA